VIIHVNLQELDPSSVLVDSRERLFGKRCVFEEIGEARSREPLNAPCAEIPKEVVKAGRRLPTNDIAKARLELVFHCQPGEFSQDRA
jgi:hypothetical protein